MSQKLHYGTKTLCTKFELNLWGVRMGAKSLKLWKYYRGARNSFQFSFILGLESFARLKAFQMGSQNSNQKAFNPLFGQKNGRNLANLATLPVFDHFWQFLAKKEVKCYPILILRPYLECSHSGETFCPKNERKLNFIFWPATVFRNIQRFSAHPQASQIELKNRIQCFGTIRQLLRH